MRAALAAIAADHITRCAVLAAGLLTGTLAFFVAAQLACSSPFPSRTGEARPASDGPRAVARSRYHLASLVALPAVILPSAREPEKAMLTFWDIVALPAYAAAPLIAPQTASEPDVTGSTDAPTPPRKRPAPTMQAVDDYLWQVYQRSPTKRDSSGDFTWKDPAAAKRFGLSMPAYVIGGMHPDFREQLYHAGRAMDKAGIRWAILSAFRDDYRQSIASGLKASARNSLHGGSARTGGYGHGRAVDVTGEDGNPAAVWRWLDAHGGKYGLHRPMPGADPAHIQTLATWNRIAQGLRQARTGGVEQPGAALTKVAAAARSEEPSLAGTKVAAAARSGVEQPSLAMTKVAAADTSVVKGAR